MTHLSYRSFILLGVAGTSLIMGCGRVETSAPPNDAPESPTIYAVTGSVQTIHPTETKIVIRHDEIPGYMVAMTMPFTVRDPKLLAGLNAGDRVTFSLRVTEAESWIEQLTRIGATEIPTIIPATNTVVLATNTGELQHYQFTNEFGQPVSFNDFQGRVLAITFFFTRCPIPEYCPRLMKNFVGAAEKLRATPNVPTNWHFLAITFDPAFDTPAVLRAYGQRYGYDSNQWSFLTGDTNRIAELAQAVDVYYEPDGAFFNHNFRTLVINPAGDLHMSFPIGGDLSALLAEEILKATGFTNR